jgi:hypothetical protein
VEYSPQFISDFARRTLMNLDRIQQAGGDGESKVFPVTQLWNSLLGLIVLPRERDENLIPDTQLADLWGDGSPLIRERKGASSTLRELVRHLRNAVSHGCVEFMPDEEREIANLTLWNLPSGHWNQPPEKRSWEASVVVSDLDRLARLIAGTYADVFATV